MKMEWGPNIAAELVQQLEYEFNLVGIPKESLEKVVVKVFEPYKSDFSGQLPDSHYFIDGWETSNIFVVPFMDGKDMIVGNELNDHVRNPKSAAGLRFLSLRVEFLGAWAAAKAYQDEFGSGTERERLLALNAQSLFNFSQLMDFFYRLNDLPPRRGGFGKNKIPPDKVDKYKAEIIRVEKSHPPGTNREFLRGLAFKNLKAQGERVTFWTIRNLDTNKQSGRGRPSGVAKQA